MHSGETNQDQLNRLLLDDPEVSKSLDKIFDEFKDTGSIDPANAAYQDLARVCADRGLTAKFVGGGNNKNISIQGDGQSSVFVQFSRKHKNAVTIIKLLYGNDQPMRWLPKIIRDSSKQEIDVNTRQATGDVFSRTVMETCAQNITQLAKENEKVSPENQVAVFKQLYAVASQMDEMVSAMGKMGVIWKDMKRENILLRRNGDVVVADTKAFEDVADLSVHGRTGFIQFKDSAREYLSPYAQDHLFSMKPEDIKGDVGKAIIKSWEREYRYVIAVILYELATGDIATPTKNQDGKYVKNFNFEHPIFKSEDGQKLREILVKMTDPDPNKRMSCRDCVSVMKRMDATKAASPRLFGGVRGVVDAVKSSLRKSPEMQRRNSLSEKDLPEAPKPFGGMGGHRGGK